MNELEPPAADRLYTRRFFHVFGAVVLFMTGLALQFHFGQYVQYLGYGVDTLGHILSISMIGTLLVRLQIGRWVDRFGFRPIWLTGTLVVALAVGSIQFTERLWLITILRALSTVASSAVMITVVVFAAQVAPPNRRAESIGTMGLAGFLGMIAGPTLGDLIFDGNPNSIIPYRVFFSASAACSLLAGGVMLLARLPRPVDTPPTLPDSAASLPGRGPSQIKVVLEHWPGAILLVSVVFGIAFSFQSTFLERLAEERGFKDIKLFFLIYCPTAMLLRLIFRRLPEQIGRTRTVLLGLVLMATGQLALVGIRSQIQLLVPGLLMGAGHCFIFPSMVDLGSERFRAESRGTAAALIFAAGDVGMLIGFAAMGEVIDAFDFDVALTALAYCVLGCAVFFAIARRRAVFSRRRDGGFNPGGWKRREQPSGRVRSRDR